MTFVAAYAKYSYDAIGWTIKQIVKKINNRISKKKKIQLLSDILSGPVKKIHGWGGKFLTGVRTVMWRIGYVALSDAIGNFSNIIDKFIGSINKKINRNASDRDIEETVRILTGFLSTGGAIATLLDLTTDGRIDGKVKI